MLVVGLLVGDLEIILLEIPQQYLVDIVIEQVLECHLLVVDIET